MLSGNQVAALVGPEAIFRAVTEALQRAQRQILLDIFLFGGETGHELADVLCERCQAGVEVKILYDPHLGGPILRPHHEPVIQRVIAAGADARPFAVAKLPGWRPIKADHNKMLLIDGGEVFVGGANFHDGSRRNHDLMLSLRGPAATYLGEIFAYHWRLAGGPVPGRLSVVPEEGTSLVKVAIASPKRQDIRQHLLTALAEAHQDIMVSMYVMGDRQVERALMAARSRGVRVRVVLDPNIQAFSLPINGMPNIAVIGSLTDGGIPVRLYPVKPGGQMHMKLAVFDHRLVVAGSANWTTVGIDSNNETALFIEDQRLASEMAAVFERDWDKAYPPDPLTWRQRLLGLALRIVNRFY